MLEYTVYNSEGLFVMSKISSATELPTLSDGNIAVSGLHNMMTRLVDNNVVAFSDAEKLEIITQENLDQIRSKRNKLLVDSDWTDLPNCSMNDAKKIEWATYRQALRDLPSNTSDPANPVWPIQPS